MSTIYLVYSIVSRKMLRLQWFHDPQCVHCVTMSHMFTHHIEAQILHFLVKTSRFTNF